MILELLDIPENKIRQLRNGGISTVEDLAAFLPKKYEDYSNVIPLSKLRQYIGQKITIQGKVKTVYPNYMKNYVTGVFTQGKADEIKVTWFNQTYMASRLIAGKEYILSGKLTYSEQYKTYSIANPQFFSDRIIKAQEPIPVYPKIKGMSEEYLKNCILRALQLLEKSPPEDKLDRGILNATGTLDYIDFLRKAHFPKTKEDVQKVKRRIAVEKLTPFCFELVARRKQYTSVSNKTIESTVAESTLKGFLSNLPYTMTEDQATTLELMCNVIAAGRRLDALIQGDVGCGKTIVAIAMALVMAKAGYQSVLMAPTGILAEQHYKEVVTRLSPHGCKVVLLSGKMKAKEKMKLLAQLKDGQIDILVGTHVVLGKDVLFKNLGLVIIDEEHRFGVEQRSALRQKTKDGTHCISMSATPIPRSMALAMYGQETLVLNIHSMPAGRKPIKTVIFSNEEKTYEAMRREILLGHQCYMICPLITDSDADGMEDIESVETTSKKMQDYYRATGDVKIGVVTGKMKPEEIHKEMEKFEKKETDILLATTIVEVGMNIPNATVMAIKNAERFGLAQLHQLRGRVGRGDSQGYCVLLSQDKNNVRLKTMEKTTDGFEIAKADLEQRGTGNLVGTEQSGSFESVSLMLQEPELYQQITQEIEHLFDEVSRFNDMAQKYTPASTT